MSPSAAVKRICPSWVLTISDRGPEPVSAVKPANFNPDAVAGLYASTLGPGCVDPAFAFSKPVDTPLLQSGNEADCHGVWGVNDEIWIIDQAATGTVKTTQTFYKCAAECCCRRLGWPQPPRRRRRRRLLGVRMRSLFPSV